MKSERRLLALSYAFPPIALPEAALSAKRLVNLPGWRADVIASARFHPKIPCDPDLVPYAESSIASVTRLSPLVPAVWPIVNRFGLVPDPFRYFNRSVVRTARSLKPELFDAMLSWSQYHSIHLAARQIKFEYKKLPWVAHFSDPWADNPFGGLRGKKLAANRALERSVIETADRVLFTTAETLDLVMAKYPSSWREKSRVIPHGFEPALYSGERPPAMTDRRKILRYIGNFYGARTPRPLFRALVQALRLRPSLANEISVEIIGTTESNMDVSGGAKLPDGLIVFRKPVGYRESLRLMETADLLLVIDAPAEKSVFLPSKLVDYLGAHRPILALSPEGASARILRELGETVVHPDETESAAVALINAVEYGSATTASPGREAYSASYTGKQLADVLAELC